MKSTSTFIPDAADLRDEQERRHRGERQNHTYCLCPKHRPQQPEPLCTCACCEGWRREHPGEGNSPTVCLYRQNFCSRPDQKRTDLRTHSPELVVVDGEGKAQSVPYADLFTLSGPANVCGEANVLPGPTFLEREIAYAASKLPEIRAADEVAARQEPAPRPDHVTIGPYLYRIEFSQAAIDRERVEQKAIGLMGNCSYLRLLINIAPDCALDQQKASLLHEMEHAILHNAGHWDNQEELKHEEFVEITSIGMLDVLRRNSHVARWLLEW